MKVNVVQVEFFHVGGERTTSLGALIAECRERIADGLELVLQGGEGRAGIKTVVRFYDVGGVMTKTALQAEHLERRKRKNVHELMGATGFRGWWLNRQSRRLAGKSLALKDRVKTLAAQQLREAVRGSRDIAVERFDHSFRPMQREEAHELVVAAERAKSAWLYIFEPNDLLANKNSMVARAM